MGLLSWTPSQVNGENLVVTGRVTHNEAIQGVDPPCPPGEICMSAWFRYRIRVERVLSGSAPAMTIHAARIQHAESIINRRELAHFVLSPISDPKQRKLLRATHRVVEYVRPDDSAAPAR